MICYKVNCRVTIGGCIVEIIKISGKCPKGHVSIIHYPIEECSVAAMMVNKDLIDHTIYEFCPVCKVITTLIVTEVLNKNLIVKSRNHNLGRTGVLL